MKKYFLLGLLALFLTAAFTHGASAQTKKKKKPSKTDQYFDDSGFTNKLWYGGNFTLGFSGGNNQSYFAFGLTPMVGYKLIDDIVSVGPRAGFEYNNIRIQQYNGGPVYKVSPLSYSVGAFARVKPFQNFFGHFEYEYKNTDSTDPNRDGYIEIDPNGKIVTGRVPYNNVYVGIGYTSGGLWGYEILLLYNVNQPTYTVDSPFDIRFGITYKF